MLTTEKLGHYCLPAVRVCVLLRAMRLLLDHIVSSPDPTQIAWMESMNIYESEKWIFKGIGIMPLEQ